MVIVPYMDEKIKMFQREMIVDHLKKYGSITAKQAEERYAIMRLGARIHDLRKKGYIIITVMVKQKNRFGVETRFAKYILKGCPDDDKA